MNKFFVLHGHFYQPPREDPWWQFVARQPSAYPSHDWNERIYWECYLPNATSRTFNREGNIVEMVNNYSYINFNFGPTLLLWLRQYHPEFIEFLKEGDKEGMANNDGHGNAIAQSYNHMIMPLANEHDKDTQIYWGKRFFEHIFGRETEGFWLPETACNYETLKCLVKHNIKYIILSPHQAEKFRKIGDKEWIDVSNGSIGIKTPYRIFLDEEKNKYIDCFFYHGELSHAISFQHIMRSAQFCADKIASFYEGDDFLVSIATDGETFGHHHPFSEMCLGHLMKHELPDRGIQCVNFANFLSKYPPEYEVEIKRGENDLGTAWSCSHGVKRWMDDCGCRIGTNPKWNQKWRKPLRETLDWLRSELDKIFLKEGAEIFKDPWRARNEFIEIIISPSDDTIKKFASQNLFDSEGNVVKALKLLEMEHMGMLFYTSCGWFFDELSGIETVQNLRYAARAIQLAREVSAYDLEKMFMEKLSQAKSNISKFHNGRDIYQKQVLPDTKEWDHYITSFLIYNSFLKTDKRFYKFEIDNQEEHKIVKGKKGINIGRIKCCDSRIKEYVEKMYLVDKGEEGDFNSTVCYLNEFEGAKFDELKQLFEGEIWISDKNKLKEVIEKFFTDKFYRIKDIHIEEQEKIVEQVFAYKKESIFKALDEVWAGNKPLWEKYKDIGLMLPSEMHFLGASIWNYKIKDALLKFKHDMDFKWIEGLNEFFKKTKQLKLNVKEEGINRMVRSIAEELSFKILNEPNSNEINVLIQFHGQMKNLNIDYYTYIVQNNIAALLHNVELTPELEKLSSVYDLDCKNFLRVKNLK
ncbi:MAG: DUF3536 domain-containing protein [Candidatus Saelkia tenebricola]|nr:DUF3536 domain-containing protein [Candidatus Saelkia tenebricola]